MYIFFVNFTLFLCFSSFVASFYMHVNELKYIETYESSRDLPFIRSSLHYQTVKIACVCVLVYEHIHNHMSIKQIFFLRLETIGSRFASTCNALYLRYFLSIVTFVIRTY